MIAHAKVALRKWKPGDSHKSGCVVTHGYPAVPHLIMGNYMYVDPYGLDILYFSSSYYIDSNIGYDPDTICRQIHLLLSNEISVELIEALKEVCDLRGNNPLS